MNPAIFWSLNSKDYDTYMVTSTNKIVFDIEDFYKFMNAYAESRLSIQNNKKQ